MLSYHYRCNKAIIDFSNKKYYNNKLKIKTVSQSTQPLTFVDIQPENPDSGKDNNTGNNSGSGTNENGGEKIESVSTGDESAVGFGPNGCNHGKYSDVYGIYKNKNVKSRKIKEPHKCSEKSIK